MAHSGDLAGVLAELSRLRGRVDTLDALPGQVDTLTAQVQVVGEAVDELDRRERAAKPPPIWWDLLTDDEIAQLRPEFLAWLRDTLAPAYPDLVRDLSPCWEAHTPARQALTAAWRTWQAAYLNRSADARDDADWLLRWVEDLVRLAVFHTAECRENRQHSDPQPLPDALLASFEPVQDR